MCCWRAQTKRVLSFPLPLTPLPTRNTAIITERISSHHLSAFFRPARLQAHCWIGKCFTFAPSRFARGKDPMPWRIPNLLTLPVPRAEIPPVCACFKCSIAIRPAALPYPWFEIRVSMIRFARCRWLIDATHRTPSGRSVTSLSPGPCQRQPSTEAPLPCR